MHSIRAPCQLRLSLSLSRYQEEISTFPPPHAPKHLAIPGCRVEDSPTVCSYAASTKAQTRSSLSLQGIGGKHEWEKYLEFIDISGARVMMCDIECTRFGLGKQIQKE
jgi:hypothetical protein